MTKYIMIYKRCGLPKLYWLGLLAVVSLSSSTLFAQGQPGAFFGKDFAKSPIESRDQGDEKLDPRLEQMRPKKTSSANEKLADPKDFFGDATAEQAEQEEQAAWVNQSEEAESNQPEALKVVRIGAIINSFDDQHFAQSMKELIDVTVENDLAVGTIYSVGLPFGKQDYAEMFKPVLVRGGMIKLRGTPPEEYDVKLSPAWLVETIKGTYILEAVRPLRKYFNSKNEFIDRTAFELMSDVEIVFDKTVKDEKPPVVTAQNGQAPVVDEAANAARAALAGLAGDGEMMKASAAFEDFKTKLTEISK